MSFFEPLPAPATTAYADLLLALMRAPLSARGISYITRTIKGRRYWYLQYVISKRKTSHYLGPATPELDELVERAKSLPAADADDIEVRERLVATGIAAGLMPVAAAEGRVYEALVQSALFEAGGALVGTHAFVALGNLLGVRWQAATRTEDIDVGHDPNVSVAVIEPEESLESLLRRAEKAFFAVPALNPKGRSTSFKVRGKAISVSLLTPARGSDSESPVPLPQFQAAAEPVRFLEYLTDKTLPAAIPYRAGLFVRVPDPARFALHKLVVSQRRPATETAKARKDIAQSAAVISVLSELRPGDLREAADAARSMPEKFSKQLLDGAGALPEEQRSIVRNLMK